VFEAMACRARYALHSARARQEGAYFRNPAFNSSLSSALTPVDVNDINVDVNDINIDG
jgi:hypothetical protein